MGLAMEKQNQKYSYSDYLKWADNERWELILGEAFDMSPAPGRKHQDISGALFNQIYNFLNDKPCKVYAAPFDVRIPDGDEKDEDIDTVVQPDIIVVCDETKLDDKGLRGVPDLIIEILSPYTSKKDWNEKFNLYEKAGVREYWLADPMGKVIHQYEKVNTKFELKKLHEGISIMKSVVLDGLKIELAKIFAE